MVTELYITQKH